MIRRLKTIHHLLQVKDIQELYPELEGFKQAGYVHEVNDIAALLAKSDFAAAMEYCNQIIARQTLPVAHELNLSGLRTQINLLRTQISVKQFKVAEANRKINQFRVRHNSEIGMLISKILKLKTDILYVQMQKSDQNTPQFESAKKDYREYSRARRDFKKLKKSELSEDEKSLAKKLFREASKLCHPDVVDEALQDEARRIFSELNEAYAYNDIRKIEELLNILRNKKLLYKSQVGENTAKNSMEALAGRLQAELMQVDSELSEIENTDVFRTLSRISDPDRYFADLKLKFQNELAELEEMYAKARNSSEA
jgi:hypothetical protein